MTCPYCGGLLEQGALYSQSFELAWFPQGKRPPKFGAWSYGGISLGGRSLLHSAHAQASYCPTCKVVIMKAEERGRSW